MPTTACLVLTTVGDPEAAALLIRQLLDRRLIACGTFLAGARSLYRWQGRLADETETVLLLKTEDRHVAAIGQAFEELHPYETPELLAFAASGGLLAYLSWLSRETSARPD